MKKFNTGLVISDFHIFDNNDKKIVDAALDACEMVVLFICTNEFRNIEHPFTYLVRAKEVDAIYENEIADGRLIVLPLDANPMNAFKFYIHAEPECLFKLTNEKSDLNIETINIDPDIEINRKDLPCNILDKDYVQQRVPNNIMHFYDLFKTTIEQAYINKNIK